MREIDRVFVSRVLPNGRIFRYTMRVYEFPNKRLMAVQRIFDGPEEWQGFHAGNEHGKWIQLKNPKTWKDLEEMAQKAMGGQ